MSACRKPCPTCPFRVDQDARSIPGFRLELAEQLVETCSGQFGATIFACHQSKFEAEVVCISWLARHGADSIAIRLKVIAGQIDPEALQPGDDWPKTHETYAEVLDKLRATA